MTTITPTPARRRSFLDWVELIGNKLPEPVLLFAMLAVCTVLVSGLGASLRWKVQPVQPRVVTVEQTGADGTVTKVPKLDAQGRPEVVVEPHGDPISVRNLMTRDGVYWAL